MSLQSQVVEILTQVLHLNDAAYARLGSDTPLINAIPEFDSMAVVSIITSLEEQFGFVVDDDEIDASLFETVGTLVAFVEQKSV